MQNVRHNNNNKLHDRVQRYIRKLPDGARISMINTVLGWGTAAPHWSEAMKLLFWISLVVFFLIAPLLSTDQSGSLVSTADIGDAQTKGNVLSDLAPRSDAQLELARRQASPTISPLATVGVNSPMAVSGMAVVMYLSHEHETEGLTFRLRILEGTHIRMAGDTWPVKHQDVPGFRIGIRLTYRAEE
ncbi:hypothetical protein [Mycobacteroides salmoniphilum]|uniref:hypothetical protein n=1 Tax=Mycobacteroides salmoniphilum TaxID=404941 RepID=UPI0010670950|nr:hypothetical protein [Mycobacteroides salmoniphilum]